MMGSAIIALALTSSYEAIGIAAPILAIVSRVVQGFSLGGEVGPTTAYLMEAAAADRRGFAVSWQPASQQIAATTGALVGLVLSELMTSEALDAYGWRIAFLIGAVTLPFGLWMRSGLPETLHAGRGYGWLREWALSGVIVCQHVVDIAAPVLRLGIVTVRLKFAAQVMRTNACLHADQAPRYVREPRFDLTA